MVHDAEAMGGDKDPSYEGWTSIVPVETAPLETSNIGRHSLTVYVLYGRDSISGLRHPVLASMHDTEIEQSTRRILDQDRVVHLPAMLDVSRWFAHYEATIVKTALAVSEGMASSSVVLIDTEDRETARSFAHRVELLTRDGNSVLYNVMPISEYSGN